MKMQSRRREHGSSSGEELDVFGATSYFAAGGLPPTPEPDDDDDDDCLISSVTAEPSSAADRLFLFQANNHNKVHQQHQFADGLHDEHEERHCHAPTNKQLQLQAVPSTRRQSSASGKSKLAALLSSMVMVSPSPRASFRKEAAPSSTWLRRQAAARDDDDGDEREPATNNNYKAPAAATSSSSSRDSISIVQLQLQGLLSGAHHVPDDEVGDLGVATGDRRLQGITVVRGGGGGGGDEERWVVRCVPGPGGGVCWDWDDEERRRASKVLDAEAETAASSERNIKDETVEVEEQLQGDDEDDGNKVEPAAHCWDSDSSSDLFDLDLESR